VVSADGSDRRDYLISNFTAANASGVQFHNNMVSVASSSTIAAEDTDQNVSIVITIERLNSVRIDLDAPLVGDTASPVYGIVDKLTVSEGGQEIRVISR
jgi:hypothetical protein